MAIVDLLGMERGIAVLPKADLAEPPWQAKVSADIARLLKNTKLADAPIIPVSTVSGDGISELREHLFDTARMIRAHAASGRFRLAVDRSFTLTRAGPAVPGTILSGAVSVGDRVRLSPPG